MAVTLKQIAQKSGLSLMTVSCVLNDKGHLFRPETCRRVIDAAEELGYRPNSSARAMRQGRFNSVGLVVSNSPHKSYLPRGLLSGIESVLVRHDQHLTVTELPDQMFATDQFVPKLMRESMADGLLINYIQEIPARLIELLEGGAMPAVWTNVKRESDCVRPDDVAAGRMLTEQFLRLGHRRIAYVDYVHDFAGLRDHYSAADRYDGYCQAMQSAGLPPRLIRDYTNLPPSRVEEIARGWLAEPDRPTAIVAYRHGDLQGILLAAISMGIRVPQDLSMATFSGVPIDIGRSITTALAPEQEMGVQAAVMLLEKIAEPKRKFAPRILPYDFTGPDSSVTAAAESMK